MQRKVFYLAIPLLLLGSWCTGLVLHTSTSAYQSDNPFSTSTQVQPSKTFEPPARGLPQRRIGGGTR